MKINNLSQQFKQRKLLIIISSVVLAIIIAGGAFAYVNYSNEPSSSNKDSDSVNLDPATNDQTENGDSIKNNSVNNGDASDSGSDQPEDSTSQQNGKDVFNVVISAQNINSGTLQLRFRIDTEITDGTCTLTLSKPGSSSIVRTAPTFQSGGQYSTCQGFDIATSDLDSGTWTIDLSFENATKYGHVTGAVTL